MSNSIGPTVPEQCAPRPVDTYAAVAQIELDDGAVFVVLQVHTPTGVGVYFFDPQAARTLGSAMQKAGSASAAGLIMPGS